jgi:hypothetical protein
LIVFFDNEEEIFERIDFGAELVATPALRAHRSTALAVVRFRRAACLPTLTSLQLLLRATVADDAEPTRLRISGVGATGT